SVEAVVDVGARDGIAARGDLLHLPHEPAQALDVLVQPVAIGCEPPCGESFECPAAVVDLAGAARGEARHEGATARHLLDETPGGEPADRLPNGRAADAHLLRDPRIRDPRAPSEARREDRVAQVA